MTSKKEVLGVEVGDGTPDGKHRILTSGAEKEANVLVFRAEEMKVSCEVNFGGKSPKASNSSFTETQKKTVTACGWSLFACHRLFSSRICRALCSGGLNSKRFSDGDMSPQLDRTKKITKNKI